MRSWRDAGRRIAAAVLGALVALLIAIPAQAQVLPRFALRLEDGAGTTLGYGSRSALAYDGAHLQITARLAYNVLDWLSAQVSVNNGVFLGSGAAGTGRTLALQAGLRAEPWVRRLGRLWIDGNAGIVFTGDDRAFGFDAGVGFEFQIGHVVGLGPYVRVHDVVGDGTVNGGDHALFLSAGASLTLRIPEVASHPDPSPPVSLPPSDRDHDGVLDADDVCPDVPRIPYPDPARNGCGLPDDDRDGVPEPPDACPGVPGLPSPDPTRNGCPAEDRDHDGIADADDACPDVSRLPFPDPARNGCPLPDDDHDGVPEPPDACPGVPGVPSLDPHRNGCPNMNLRMEGGRIRILEQVNFATDRDVIEPQSFPVLAAVADVMRAALHVRRISIDGHTDDRASTRHNLLLSQRRARAVMAWLVAHGIDASRLEAHGYGQMRPIAPNRSAAGRARNRRVEFLITRSVQGVVRQRVRVLPTVRPAARR